MSALIISGPPASGKNTIGALLAPMRKRCALIDVDLVRHMLFHPHKAPWEGEEGRRQQKLGIKNTCLLAQNFRDDDADVIILDVLSDETAKLYREEFGDIKIALLMPKRNETYRRFIERHHSITEDEFQSVFKQAIDLRDFDKVIDNTFMSASEMASLLNGFMNEL